MPSFARSSQHLFRSDLFLILQLPTLSIIEQGVRLEVEDSWIWVIITIQTQEPLIKFNASMIFFVSFLEETEIARACSVRKHNVGWVTTAIIEKGEGEVFNIVLAEERDKVNRRGFLCATSFLPMFLRREKGIEIWSAWCSPAPLRLVLSRMTTSFGWTRRPLHVGPGLATRPILCLRG